MSKLTVKGSGIDFRQVCLDAYTAGEMVIEGETPDDFYVDQDEFGELNTLCSGFFCDSTVSLDGKEIGTVKSIVNKARKLGVTKKVRQYSSDIYINEVIKEAGLTSFVLETHSTSGVLANFEIHDYILDEKRKVPDQFILDFANSLKEEAPGVYFFEKWNENRIENAGIDCEEFNEGFTLFNRGKEIEI